MSTVSTWIDELRSELGGLSPKIGPILTVLEVAQSVTGIGGPGAATALQVIATALSTLGQAQAGTLTHDQLVQQLASLQAEANTAFAGIEGAQDAALAAKFPPAGGA